MKFIENAKTGQNKGFQIALSLILVISAIYGIGQVPLGYFLDKYNITGKTVEIILGQLVSEIGKTSTLVLMLFPFIVGLLSLIFAIRYMHKRSANTLLTGRESFDFKRFWFSFSLWGAFILVIFFAEKMANPSRFVFQFDAKAFFNLAAVCLFILPLQVLFEELLFRGYLLQQFGMRTKKAIFAVAMQGILFGLMHLSNPEVDSLGSLVLVYYIVMGSFLGLITYLDDGTELAVGFHAANNIINTLLITNLSSVFQVDALYNDKMPMHFSWTSWVEIFVLLPLLVYVFHRVYKWKNWSDLWVK